MKKYLLYLLIVFTFIAGAVTSVVWLKIAGIENTVLSNESSVTIEVGSGDTLYKIIQSLLQYADIDAVGFKIWLKFNPEFSNIKRGNYELAPNSSLISVLSMLKNGDVKQYSVTLLEGQTASQWFSQLSKNQNLKHDIQSEASLYSILMSIDNSFCENDREKLEGCLLPDTYFFEKNSSSSLIIERSFNAMRIVIGNAWNDRFKDIPISTPYQALILASIIEKETAVESERSEIAGVFTNRLKQNMRLQTDPTVIYGLGDQFNGDITRKHLRTPTPYNTRIIKGLPPTPIAMPNRASIRASVRPATTNSLYFVATGYGGHQFSNNLTDHNKAVKAYVKNRKQQLEKP